MIEGVEAVGGVDALKVDVKFTEDGEGGVSAKSTWWLNKSGKVLKFEVKVTDWVVPMAGNGYLTATIKATLKKSA
jgi:hypothetical protein